MRRYIALLSFTDQGIRNVKQSLKRAEWVKKIAAKHKVNVPDTYWTMRRHDNVVHFDPPSDEAMMAFTLDNAQHGNVRTETCRAFSEEEFKKILKAL